MLQLDYLSILRSRLVEFVLHELSFPSGAEIRAHPLPAATQIGRTKVNQHVDRRNSTTFRLGRSLCSCQRLCALFSGLKTQPLFGRDSALLEKRLSSVTMADCLTIAPRLIPCFALQSALVPA
jgi:hypothetical protein